MTMNRNVRLGMYLMLLTAALVGCQTSPSTPTSTGDLEPASQVAPDQRSDKLTCDNGLKFTITFPKNQDIAYLVLSGSKAIEILEDNQIGDGVSYGNKKYTYENHDGIVTLTAGTSTTCRLSSGASEEARQAPEEKFIQNIGNKANGIIVDTSLTPAQLNAKYHKLLDGSFDIQTINEFVIGRTWTQVKPEQKQEYLKLFKELVLRTYGGHLRFHNGEGFHVNGIRAQSETDTVVSTQITHTNGTPPTLVDWIVHHKNGGKLVIVDVIVDGVSQNKTQRDEFASILAQNGSDFNALLNTLRQKVQPSSSND